MSALRECPRAGCTKRITSDLFACSSHWYSLPRAERDAIWRAYRAWSAGGGTFADLETAHDRAFAIWGQDGPE